MICNLFSRYFPPNLFHKTVLHLGDNSKFKKKRDQRIKTVSLNARYPRYPSQTSYISSTFKLENISSFLFMSPSQKLRVFAVGNYLEECQAIEARTPSRTTHSEQIALNRNNTEYPNVPLHWGYRKTLTDVPRFYYNANYYPNFQSFTLNYVSCILISTERQ